MMKLVVESYLLLNEPGADLWEKFPFAKKNMREEEIFVSKFILSKVCNLQARQLMILKHDTYTNRQKGDGKK